ncbi:MAG: hypothetical protein H6714_09665 [Myxococcales bacterium]|nr:hypothetical protein [Myxococcales bacterium]
MTHLRLLLMCLFLTMAASGCGESLVGAHCKGGYARRGKQCVSIVDAAVPDGSADVEMPDTNDDADTEPDAGPLSCPIGTVLCGDICVDPNDPSTCGGCSGSVCAGGTPVCQNGACAPDCAALGTCDGLCVDLDTDPQYCGDCATRCLSNICNNGLCAPQTFGHVVVIGHDYQTNTSDAEINKLVGNAIFISPSAPVRVLAYQQDATANAISGTNNAIDEHPEAVSRNWTKTVVSDANLVPFLLYSHNAFLIYAEPNASDSALIALGNLWKTSLEDFIRRGGIVISLESPSSNLGTYQILDAAALFEAGARSSVPQAPSRLSLVAGGDLVAGSGPSALPAQFNSILETSSFADITTPNTTIVVEDGVTKRAVATHLAVPPQ